MDNKMFKKELINEGLYKYKDNKKVSIQTTEFPTNFSIKKVKILFDIQKDINKIFSKALLDENNFIKLPTDPIYEILIEIKNKKQLNCNINFIYLRSDYIIDKLKTPKLVEYNSQSIGLNFLGPSLNKLHSKNNKNVKISKSDIEFIEGIKIISNLYSNDCISLMIDEKTSNDVCNYSEKQMIIKKLLENNIEMIHVTMNDIKNKASFSDNEMFYNNKKVFLVYYRWFYNESHYNINDIKIRIQIESSNVVSLPTVELQILGLKYFQVTLSKKIEKYEKNYKEIIKTFVDYKEIKEFNKGNEKDFVLKTFNEGGNSNYFDNEIINKIEEKFENGFLMRKIEGFPFKNMINGIERNVVIEIGIFGVFISKQSKILYNQSKGFIVRTKEENNNECGVSCGNGFLDSILK